MFGDTFSLGIQDLANEMFTNTRVPELIQSEWIWKLGQMTHIKLATATTEVSSHSLIGIIEVIESTN